MNNSNSIDRDFRVIEFEKLKELSIDTKKYLRVLNLFRDQTGQLKKLEVFGTSMFILRIAPYFTERCQLKTLRLHSGCYLYMNGIDTINTTCRRLKSLDLRCNKNAKISPMIEFHRGFVSNEVEIKISDKFGNGIVRCFGDLQHTRGLTLKKESSKLLKQYYNNLNYESLSKEHNIKTLDLFSILVKRKD